MKIKPGFNLRDVCGEFVIIAEGKDNVDFNKIITLNESSVVLWNAIKDKDFTVSDIADILMSEYEVDSETALKDSQRFVEILKNINIIA